ncbi:hypothetical protein FUAX_29650 [Fulvitalea axinellae]|uniref:Uncharacterized protein n=1 Tax=Fulvitalea axinellae TaxID=1182444 RepID=A0AAU9CR14_9BACT|nr:hypothetical protein FUAX_29650 [Fulvitalea axinellae]
MELSEVRPSKQPPGNSFFFSGDKKARLAVGKKSGCQDVSYLIVKLYRLPIIFIPHNG